MESAIHLAIYLSQLEIVRLRLLGTVFCYLVMPIGDTAIVLQILGSPDKIHHSRLQTLRQTDRHYIVSTHTRQDAGKIILGPKLYSASAR